MLGPTVQRELASFDGGVRAGARVVRPDRYRFWDRFPADARFIPRGGGYSYAAASFGAEGSTIEHASFDRILDFDSATGQVRVEAGATLGALHGFLAARGWYLPTQPGFSAITVGGCIAAECHGKNHARDGCFSRQVMALELFHPTTGLAQVSREREPDLFHLTCGGYGLTGCIVSAILQPRRIAGSAVTLRHHVLDDVRDLPGALKGAAASADLAYSWHDFNDGGRGRGVIVSGTLEGTDEPSPRTAPSGPAFTSDTRSSWRYPAWNRASATLATGLYRRLTASVQPRRVALAECLFPMDTRGNAYYRFFGRPGFCEYQAVIPEAAFRPFCDAVFARLRSHPVAITLASGKWFDAEQGDLRFSGTGPCFALNFPRDGRAPAFLAFLDGLAAELSMRPNLVKDSRIPRAAVERAYPELGSFAARLRAFDPARRCRSELSERLGL